MVSIAKNVACISFGAEVGFKIGDEGMPVIKAVDEGEHDVFERFVVERQDFDDRGFLFFHCG